MRKFLKYLSLTIATLIVLLAISVGLLPSVLKWGIQNWLEQQHLESDIESIELQLFDGRLNLHNFSIKQGEQQILKLGSLVVQLNPRELLNRKIILQQFSLNDFELQIEEKQGKAMSFAGVPVPVTTATPVTIPITTSPKSIWQLEIQNFDLSRLNICYKKDINPDQQLCTSLQQLKWHGQLALDLYPNTDDLLNSLKTDISLTLNKLKLTDVNRNATLAGFDQIALHSISTQGIQTIKIKEINFNGLVALQRHASIDKKNKNYVLQSKFITANDISILKQQNVSLSNVKASGLEFTLQRDTDGKLEPINLLNEYRFNAPPSSNTATPVDDTTKPIIFSLAEVSLLDRSAFYFIDNAVKPASQLDFNNIQVSLKKVDSNKRQFRSPLTIDMQVGQHGQLQLQGNIIPFAARPTLKLDGQLKGINISDFNAYIQPAIQHYVKSGHLDAETSINIDQGQLDSTSQLILHKFYVEPVSEQSTEEYEEQLGLPLGTALSLLRDSDNSIHLKLPVTGDINAPDFSINNVISKVSTKAIKTAVINYYTPLGIFNIAGGLYDLATALRFDPVEFKISEDSLDTNDKEQLDKLALILIKRPGIHIIICGVTTQADRLAWFTDEFEASTNDEGEPISVLPALNNDQSLRLNKLATQRGLNVKSYLYEVKKIEPKRLILCTPKHTPGDTQPPRVELQL